MSVSPISMPTALIDGTNQNVISRPKAIQQEFQQLGRDLAAGDLSAAQSDFATLEQLVPKLDSISTSQPSDPRVKAFQQLGQDLQSGDLAAAQQDYTKIQQLFQKLAERSRHHPHEGSGINGAPGGIVALLQQLGQALQSGDLSAAQQTFATLQQQFLEAGQNGQAQPQSSSPSFSVSA